MADHVLCTRTPDEIMVGFGSAQYALEMGHALGPDAFDLQSLIWDVINSVRDSYALALRGMGYEGATLAQSPGEKVERAPRGDRRWKAMGLTDFQIAEVEKTVDDYLSNAFGDD